MVIKVEIIALIYCSTFSVFFTIFTPLSYKARSQTIYILIQHDLFVRDDLFDDQFEELAEFCTFFRLIRH